MTILKQMQRFNKVNKLISEENTGNPHDFAEKLNVSRRQMFNILEQFKEFDAPIKYNKKNETYYYASDFNLELQYSLKQISENEEKIIFAGFFQSAILLHGTPFTLPYQNESSARFLF
jgi:hypothetical protein